jgi:predicted aldo/keto reductase-like oxidoreductase
MKYLDTKLNKIITKRESNKYKQLNKDCYLIEVSDTDARYIAMILDKNHVWTEQDIIQFRSRLHGSKSNCNPELLNEMFFENIPEDGYKITKQQSDKGIEFLKKTLFKIDGTPRNTELAKHTDTALFEAIADFESFSFVDLHGYTVNMRTGSFWFAPVYRIHTKSGKDVDYCYVGGSFGPENEFIVWAKETTMFGRKQDVKLKLVVNK